MKALLLLLVLCFASPLWSQEGVPSENLNDVVSSELSTLINSTEYNSKNISVTAADDTKTFKSLRDLEEEFTKGAKFYQKEKYEKAYPIFAELSQWGIKSAQSLLGTMYIQGQHVGPSIERGLAWLGVANELGGYKSSKANFDYVYNQLNDEQKKIIDVKVQSYIAKFGAKTQNITCKKKKGLGSNIPVQACSKTPGSNSPLHSIE